MTMTDQELRDLVASLAVSHAEFREDMQKTKAENDKWHTEFREDMQELRASQDKFRKDMDASHAKMQQDIKDLGLYIESVTKELRGLGVTQGDIAEEEFYQSLERHKRLGALHFDTIERKVQKNASSPEFDILLINGDSVGLIEVKANLRTYLKNKYYVKREGNKPKSFDMKRCIDDKVNDFRDSCPEYKNYKLYFGFGSLVTDDKLIAQAKENGIFLLTQKGNHIELVNDSVKPF